MAYKSSTERVAEIRNELKSEFPDFKFSITKRGYNGVNIAILSGSINMVRDIDEGKDEIGVNHYWIETNYKDYPEIKSALEKMYGIASRGVTYTETGDYGNQPDFYVNMSIGDYKKPFKYIPKKGGKRASTSSSSAPSQKWDRGQVIRECAGWKVYKKTLPDGRIVYNAVKDKETAPNKGDWNAIRGEVYTDTAFKWGRFGAFEKWGVMSNEEEVLGKLCQILTKYYAASSTPSTPEPPQSVPAPTPSSDRVLRIETIVSKLNWSEGLKEMMIKDFKSSGYGDVMPIVGKDEKETSQNIQDRIIGFSSGKHTYLQANMLATLIHEELDSTPSEPEGEITARVVADFLKYINDFALDFIGVKSGGELKQSAQRNELQQKYGKVMDTTLEGTSAKKYMDKLSLLGSEIRDILEDENYHTLNNYLGLKGHFGDDAVKEYINLFEQTPSMFLNPANFNVVNPDDNIKTSIYINGKYLDTLPNQKDAVLWVGAKYGAETYNRFMSEGRISIKWVDEKRQFRMDVLEGNIFEYGKNFNVPADYGRYLQFELMVQGNFKVAVAKTKNGMTIYRKDSYEDGMVVYDNGGEFSIYTFGTTDHIDDVAYDVQGGTVEPEILARRIIDVYNKHIKPEESEQETDKDKIRKSIAGLQILADKGNEKARKAIIGLQILLNK